MAKFCNEVEVKVGSDGLIVLREPSNKEWADYQAASTQFGRNGKMTNNSVSARAALFDTLLTRIENVEDGEGPLAVDTAKTRISARRKSEIIFKAFDQGAEEIDVKNS